MKKKNGFTLVELIAVIAILAIILLVAIPSVSSVLSNHEDKELDKKKQLIVSASELYLSSNKDLYTKFIKGTCYLTTSMITSSPKDYLSYDEWHDSNQNPINIYIIYDTQKNEYIYQDESPNGYSQCS